MNKLIFGGMLILLGSVSTLVYAQHPGSYMRKPLPAPNFFVPQKALPQPEKLPPFNIPEQEENIPEEVVHKPSTPAPTITFEREEETSPEKNSPAEEFNPKLDVSLPEPEETTAPKYKQEYDAYVKDLKVIAETGKAPTNPELEKDLEKLNSEDRLKVDEEGRITEVFQQSQLINPMASGREYGSTTVQILEQEEIDRSSSFVSEEAHNPFADGKEVEAMSPETAAYFGGINPFYDGDVISYDEEEDSDKGKQIERLTSEIQAEAAPEEEAAQPEPEAYTPPEPKKTHSSGNRNRGRRANSAASFNLGPNMVR